MLKIMVADDEPLYRKYLVESFDWNKYGFTVCCEAQNGLDALEKAKQFHPDVALVDINMPLMNGIELIEKLRQSEPEIRTILLTGHSEFEYMRTAIQLEVSDYILKPFNNEELQQALLRVKDDIEQRRRDEAVKTKNTEMVKRQLLNALISHEYHMPVDELFSQLGRLGILPGAAWYQIAVVEIDNFHQRWSGTSDATLWQYGLSNILDELMVFPGCHVAFPGPEGRLVSLLQFREQEPGDDTVYAQYMRLLKIVRQYFSFTISVGIGERVDRLELAHQSYFEAVKVLKNKWIMGEDRVMQYSRLTDSGLRVGFYPGEINERLLRGLRMRDTAGVEMALDDIFRFVRENHLSVDYAITIFVGVVSLCLSAVTEQGKTVEEIFGAGFAPFEKIRYMESLDMIHAWFLQFFQTIFEKTQQNRPTKTRALVTQTKEYIHAHLQESELNLESISKAMYVSTSYLRKTFKKELDINISDYIQQARIQKAKELLSSCPSIAISAVSEMSGYHDISYFSKSFKRSTGMTPSEFAIAKAER